MTSTLSEPGRPRGARGRHAATRRQFRSRLFAVSAQLAETLGRSSAIVEALPAAAAEYRPAARRPEGVVEVVVSAGDTVADIAARHSASTAGVLALNGIGWRAQLVPGQVLLVKPAVDRPVTAPVAADLHRHRVEEGDTISSIAERHGVRTAAVLLANGLSRQSTVRAGQQLVIPVPNLRRSGSGVVALSGEMRENAQAVCEAAWDAGVPDDGIVVALAAAMQASSLRNLAFGPADAVGLFQQRPSDGWGHEAALLDPHRAALAFFGGTGSGVVSPAGGLLDVGGWEFMSIGEAAHAVQRTGTPADYDKWERAAREWLQDLQRD